ncbi:glycerol-3-phosphate cytidiltransferase [Jeotgalibacillus malaysiensis]|uniref:Glycerol-3-phosphate cytidiltransferase n=1 Tax=Jeotgalibacillus malaysiensis TaxID=1508404 RepID=A0A0B5AXF6_9BACL|nr:adenylyltransferase/cytidyltransferase family protein [Jeotgalibacillus malaysiensis]AJD92704.1 glycerol-3-phosphate cytidiltransferase [Jeotgalibacillus malaysiensis]
MKPYSIGYTTGVFDLFHVGHLNILRKAKEHCDYLIVGVSTDELVKQYKKKTPVISFEDRVAIVESIKYVDEVVPQVSRDKVAAWQELRFDAMFVGDDWKGSNLFTKTERMFHELGVEVVYFPYTANISTTQVKNKVKILT